MSRYRPQRLGLLLVAVAVLSATGCIPVGYGKSPLPTLPQEAREKIRRVVVLPVTDAAGKEDLRMTEALTNEIVRNSGWVVTERKALDKVISELQAQKGPLFDPGTAARLGKFAGADAVVLARKTGDAPPEYSVRLVSVETADVIASGYYEINNVLEPSTEYLARYCCQSFIHYRFTYLGWRFGDKGSGWLWCWATPATPGQATEP